MGLNSECIESVFDACQYFVKKDLHKRDGTNGTNLVESTEKTKLAAMGCVKVVVP